MSAHGAVYLPFGDVDVDGLADWLQVIARPGPDAPWFSCVIGADAVRYTVRTGTELSRNVDGMCGWLRTQGGPAAHDAQLHDALRHTRTGLGLVTEREFEDNPRIWESMFVIADRYDGFVFTHDSLLLPDGTVICGPLLDPDG